MSLAEHTTAEALGQLTWADLTADEKSEAVYWKLAGGNTVEETAEALGTIYGPIGVNQVRRVAEAEGFDSDPALIDARRYRDRLEKIDRRARVQAVKPERIKAEPLPVLPAPRLGDPRKKARVTIWDLKGWQCKRPLWGKEDTPLEEKFYCGNRRAEGSSWCAECKPIVYAPPEARRHKRGGSIFIEGRTERGRNGKLSRRWK
ncbi:GcrA family cell cycle regulator [Roseibium sediminicola]|uniref:GcrA family cell cycle regulator n=1 Tax=Roseibium sediminicola TaxID=2933272 RepID=A0ABT0H0J8_9HYPH|nr:GcrA family cell cycle regulator [Roseibium sp. CAU 1639]MCK7615211.1 GcrA family cell cycle regulator [Roseibium sp. CAU 1639]